MARAAADQFTAAVATKTDWALGLAMYIAGVVAVLIASVVWVSVRST